MTDLELTKLLAEKLMGWEPDEPGDGKSFAWVKIWNSNRDSYRHRTVGSNAGDWNPLGRIDHAWEVLEAVASLSRPAMLFLSKMSEPEDWFVPGRVASRAICKAALRAVGVEV